jgi:hypothetical protein
VTEKDVSAHPETALDTEREGLTVFVEHRDREVVILVVRVPTWLTATVLVCLSR